MIKIPTPFYLRMMRLLEEFDKNDLYGNGGLIKARTIQSEVRLLIDDMRRWEQHEREKRDKREIQAVGVGKR